MNIVTHLRKSGAVSPETAKTLAEAGVISPNAFKLITKNLVRFGVIKKVGEDRYYL